ncbi:MAG: glycosyltransferase family 9 protein [Acidobacteria bacterium]|nr:glycosyltransferase family 9 protein [Acidobacteriota bacterium]
MRLLLIRTSALGDIVHCLPVLTALRRHWPDAHVGWVVERSMASLLAGHPDIDELIPVDFRPWRRRLFSPATLKEILETRRVLRRFRADAVLELMGNHKGGLVAWASGCKVRIGLDRRSRREPSSALWINRPVPPQGVHAVDRALSVLTGLGLSAEPAGFAGERLLADPPSSAAALLAEAPEQLALVVPGTAWGNKTYPAERWGAVARGLAERVGLTTWVATGPGEEVLGEAVAAASGGVARSLGLVDLPTFAALCRHARLVLGGDTGPTHLAHALGAPVLEIMGPTDPQSHGPYAHPENTIAVRLPCSFCHRRFDGAKACLLAIPPEAVVERSLRLLETPSGTGLGSR